MSHENPVGNQWPHFCSYADCECSDRYLTKRYCRVFENGNQVHSLMYLSKESSWDVSRILEEIGEFNLRETMDQATFCCKTRKFLAKIAITYPSCGEKVLDIELQVSDQKCSAMIGPPPHLPYTLSGWAIRNMKACFMIIDENGKIIVELPLHSKDFLVESKKLAQENGEIQVEREEHPYASGEREALQQPEESQRV